MLGFELEAAAEEIDPKVTMNERRKHVTTTFIGMAKWLRFTEPRFVSEWNGIIFTRLVILWPLVSRPS
jgi:hypothetical protein